MVQNFPVLFGAMLRFSTATAKVSEHAPFVWRGKMMVTNNCKCKLLLATLFPIITISRNSASKCDLHMIFYLNVLHLRLLLNIVATSTYLSFLHLMS